MEITYEQGAYIATYLMKGAFVKNHRDICISICQNAEIGIVKHGKNYNIYIKYAGKTQYNGKNRFTNEITSEELTAYIMEAIANCGVLNGHEFNTSIMPADSRVPQPAQNMTNDDYAYVELLQNIEKEMADDDDYELQDTEEYMEETEPDSSATPYIPDKFDEPEYMQSLVGEVVEMDDNEENIDQEPPQEEYVEHSPIPTTLTVPNKKSAKLSEASYIYRISTEDEMKQHMHMVIEKLVDENKELATELYIHAMVTLLALYNNDINKMSEETGIDKRDITLAYYEQQIIKK